MPSDAIHNGTIRRAISITGPHGRQEQRDDLIAVEAPLAIRLQAGPEQKRQWFDFTTTMRTPGQDEQLALGLLFAEGIIARREQVVSIKRQELEDRSIISLSLAPTISFDPSDFVRSGFTNSSCGLCGKVSLEYLEQINCYFPQAGKPQLSAKLIQGLGQRLRGEQQLFSLTGGIHAAGLFDTKGQPLFLQEDIGRHNAIDKLLGQALQESLIPWRDNLVLVSGRAGFELVQKCVMAGTAIMAAIGAPSSLAVELAELAGMTLIGFLKPDRFNIYSHPERVLFQ